MHLLKLCVELDTPSLTLGFLVVVGLGMIAGLLHSPSGEGKVPVEEDRIGGQPESPTEIHRRVEGPVEYMLKTNYSIFTDGYINKIPGYWIHTNSRGLREQQLSSSPPEGVKRILVVGDSHTFGWGVNKSERFTDVFESKMNSDGDMPYQVVNAGIPGWGMEDYYLYLRERAPELNPDAVIVAFKFADIVSVDRNTEFQSTAEDMVPENATNRSRKVDLKRLEIKQEYFRQATVENSSLTLNTKKIEDLAGRRGYDIYFYYLGTITEAREEDYLDALDRDEIFIDGPRKLGSGDLENFRLPGPDTHYNERGHMVLGSKLYRELKDRL